MGSDGALSAWTMILVECIISIDWLDSIKIINIIIHINKLLNVVQPRWNLFVDYAYLILHSLFFWQIGNKNVPQMAFIMFPICCLFFILSEFFDAVFKETKSWKRECLT